MNKILKATIGAGAALALFAGAAFAATLTVTPTNMQGWSFVNDQTNTPGSGTFVEGPGNPPLGDGSAQLTTTGPTDGQILGKAGYTGLDLDQITTLQYSTYKASGDPAVAIALQFNIDPNSLDGNTAWQGRLVYEPYFTHNVLTGQWQTWNPMDNAETGNWWFSNATAASGTTSGGPGGGCSQADPCTWTELLTKYPNAEIHSILGGVVLKAGSGWVTPFTGNVDALTINSDVYNFELEGEPTITPTPSVRPATSKDACKNGGYMNFTDSNGQTFKNQGQCVSSTNRSK